MKFSLCLSLLVLASLIFLSQAQRNSLQDLSQAAEPLPEVTIYTAEEIITLDKDLSNANAVAVAGKRIIDVGSLEKIKKRLADQPYTVDTTFAGKVIVPGLIAQHDHPFLTALTMTSEIIAIEDWVLPSGTIPAAKDRKAYMSRLKQAEAAMKDTDETLLTWGFHHYFHGKLTREHLDAISPTRPIIVWHRSCHEFIVNTPAIKKFGITKDFLAKQTKGAQEQSNWEEGHFWEQGLFAVVAKFAPAVATPERINEGLNFMINYFHANGITLGCEPGGLFSKALQDAENAVLSNPQNPFRFYFIPDGKSIIAAHPDAVIAETEKILDWGDGMTKFLPKQVKLFADGAIYSQAMQVREPYTDGHKGEWMMDLKEFATAFRTYWDNGYQIHIHVNGDAGLDMVLNNLEANMRRNPRFDHRTAIVHFAVSQPDQVARIKRLGAIVSGNTYYPVALADKYRTAGLGPNRADPMVRIGDLERAGIPYSFHSDMPMAPAQPLFLMHCAVNRKTGSGRVAAPEQKASRVGALKAVTSEAAFSLQLDKEVGTIETGKLANFTVLAENPITCDPERIKDINVWGTIHEGRVLPVKQAQAQPLGFDLPKDLKLPENISEKIAFNNLSSRGHCGCSIGKMFANSFSKMTQKQKAKP